MINMDKMRSVWIIIIKYNSITVIITTSKRRIMPRRFWKAKETKPHIKKKQMVLNLSTEFKKLKNKKCLFARKFR